MKKSKKKTVKKILTLIFAGWFIFSPYTLVFAEETELTGTQESSGESSNNSGSEDTAGEESESAPEPCSTGCDQGVNQGADQGVGQGDDLGGPTLEELGATPDENGNLVLPAGVSDTRQGADQGTTNGISTENTNTGSDSTNSNTIDSTTATTDTVANTAASMTTATASANTGSNTSTGNSSDGVVKSGNANIGVTQIKNDNTVTNNGSAGVSISGHDGDYEGDLEVAFDTLTSLLTGDQNKSIKATNTTTGSGSTNENTVTTTVEEVTEVENDGTINNDLDLEAISGQNTSTDNTGNGSIVTGAANIAASLVNLLNTSVLNGNLLVAVKDIFGNLNGNVTIPTLATLGSVFNGSGSTTQVTASNDNTGSDSDNLTDVHISDAEETVVNTSADVNTTVNANAITGQNDAMDNTGGGDVKTGDSTVGASNVTLANTTVEGGNWALVIVNALNKWVGFLVNDSGLAQQLTQDETIRQIEAQNQNTGSDSENTNTITDSQLSTTSINDTATINNNVTANAITGQNEASRNTGVGMVETGDATIQATAVNLANTTVKNANLGVAIINIFGNWLGDLLYGGNTLAMQPSQAGHTVDINASNTNTGSNSTNDANVTIDDSKDLTVNNNADIVTTLNANIDTGNNRVNRNTKGASVQTGIGYLTSHVANVANIVAVSDDSGLSVNVNGGNDTTGVLSQNTVNVTIDQDRVMNITNDANATTLIPANVNTGNNETNQNTIGGNIKTGSIVADVAVYNMLNKILLALGQDPLEVNVYASNATTGSNSTNATTLSVIHDVLLSIFNTATVNTLADLLLNTGGNGASQNTAGGSIATGAICVNGQLVSVVNSIGGTFGSGTNTIVNSGTVTNTSSVNAFTGNNTANGNTSGSSVNGASTPCPTPTPTPSTATPTPTLGPSDNGDDDDDGGGGGNGGNGPDNNGSGGGVTTTSSSNGSSSGSSKEGRIAGVSTAAAPTKKSNPCVATKGNPCGPGIEEPVAAESGSPLSKVNDALEKLIASTVGKPYDFSFSNGFFLAGSVTALAGAAWADRKHLKKRPFNKK